jgi:apolipoprotein N-acyltransferase
LVLAAAFPKFNLAGFAWIAPALIIVVAAGKPLRQAFCIGYVAGLAHYLASLSWLLRIPVPWSWKWAPVLGWTALAAFLALIPATWVWLGWKFFPGPPINAATQDGISSLAERFVAASWAQRTGWALTAAAMWVALEMTISRIFGGFPWNLLGVSQFRLVPLIQIAAFTGVYGVSFLVVWFSLSLLSAAMVIIRKPALRSLWLAEIILPLGVVAANYGLGWHKLLAPQLARPELTAALIQPSIPQTLIWDPAGDARRFQELLQLSESALTNKPDLLIWPEAAVPGLLRADTNAAQAISNLASNHHTWMIIGADDATPHPKATNWSDSDFFNSSFLVDPNCRFFDKYNEYKKRNLVIFGEYIPLIHWLPFLKYFTPIESGYTSGDRPVPFHLTNLNVNVSVLICFEDVFPHLAREYVFDDTDFLVNLTNNGWFGEGAAQWQHAAAAVFRAVENGVPLVRCSNNGLTCWVDSFGRIRQFFERDEGDIYGPGFLIVRVPLLLPLEKRAPTFYHEHGDWFGWACVAITLLKFFQVQIYRRRSSPPV